MSLSYCPRCSRLFARGIRDVCNNCVQEIEQEYQQVVEYLREHKGSTIHEVSEATEVSVKQIAKFIREGRISTANLPNLTVPCEVCGLPIREGNMCDSCRAKLQRDMRNLQSGSRKGSSDGSSHEHRSNSAFQIRDRS
ncbi:flagellar protein [Cohnella sp. CFH 77786]|uniref:TIGR03826 family flagellar region protein n=1 Tax=Cohnella sp. CFH 77786 TaxID=2662265 RepID=UPI001C60D35D|nr:TIGR03826 family flagellar region protein [Cohnella sp. CFH 77786]MBW5448481.1 flagellar protein [Cohnella sp. CFH 77786]